MHPSIDPPEDQMGRVHWGLAAAAFGAFAALAYTVTSLPRQAVGLAEEVTARLPEAALGNPVTAVLLNFRAFDTLLEKAVLILALVGLWALVSEADLAQPAGNLRTHSAVEPQLTLLLKVLTPLALLAAFYLLWLGADEPGGAFQSGTILAAIGIMLLLGRALPLPLHANRALRWCVVAGFLVFAGVGTATALFGAGFLDYPEAWAKSITLLIEAGLALSVAVTLFLQVNGLPEGGKGGPAQ